MMSILNVFKIKKIEVLDFLNIMQLPHPLKYNTPFHNLRSLDRRDLRHSALGNCVICK